MLGKCSIMQWQSHKLTLLINKLGLMQKSMTASLFFPTWNYEEYVEKNVKMLANNISCLIWSFHMVKKDD